MMEKAYIHCLDLTSVWRRRRRRRSPAYAVEWWRRQRRRPVCVHDRAVVAAVEEIASSGIDNGGGDRQSRERRGLREFCDKKQNATGRATIYRFKTISSGS
jgi:hypothetical protein